VYISLVMLSHCLARTSPLFLHPPCPPPRTGQGPQAEKGPGEQRANLPTSHFEEAEGGEAWVASSDVDAFQARNLITAARRGHEYEQEHEDQWVSTSRNREKGWTTVERRQSQGGDVGKAEIVDLLVHTRRPVRELASGTL